jgi:hypothetical protein
MRRSMLLSPALLAVLSLTLSTPAAPPPPATLADAQAAFAAKEYRPCLQKIAGALAGPEGKAGSPTRYDLLMLRGECMLHLKENRMAADSFTSAANVAKSKQDRKRQADAMALSLLIKASKPAGYTPAGNPSGEPIDIVDPDSRKRAMSAFFADTLAAAKPKIEQAAQATSLPPIEEQIPKMRELYALEVAATGDAAQTLPLARALGQHARGLIGAEFTRIAARLDELATAASSPVLLDGRGATSSILTPRGLTTPERNDLKQIADTLTQAERAAQQGRWIAHQSDGPEQAWDALLADCSELKSRAQQLWDHRY